MRRIENSQFKLGEIPIADIKIDLKSRDDIPQVLLGLQYVYSHPKLRDSIFSLLQEVIVPDTDSNNGRPGMEQWKIFVLGVLRLNLNCDYDRIHELANNHKTIRQMLGHATFADEYEYKLQTVKDNVALLTPELLGKINKLVIDAGHKIVKKKDDEKLNGRCDSFVVETNVHYPTDINLLYDSMRKVITLVAYLCTLFALTEWRQSSHNIKKIKRLFRRAQKLKRSSSNNPEKKEAREKVIIAAHLEYIDTAKALLEKARNTAKKVNGGGVMAITIIFEIEEYMKHADRQIDQIYRRVVEGEVIPHDKKVFSVFEPHTEWISKGKAGVPVELGLKVCVLEDQYGFILHHQVLQNQTDEQVAVSMIEHAQEKFPTLSSCSFDKGFHSPRNQKELIELLNFVVLPKKGRLSKKDKEREHSEKFIKTRYQHAAVESAINALEVHGLDRCPDHGLHGFNRYVSLAILSRNLQLLGVAIKKKQLALQQRKEKLKLAA